MGFAAWSFSLIIFAVILAFNLFAMDSIIRMRGDVLLMRKAFLKLVPPTPQEHANIEIQKKPPPSPAQKLPEASKDLTSTVEVPVTVPSATNAVATAAGAANEKKS